MNDSVVLAFLECSCFFENLAIRQKEPVSQICAVSFCNFGNWATFGLLRIKCLFYIWTILLITVHTFAVVIITLRMRKCAILLHLAWLNILKAGFHTVFALLPQSLNSSSSLWLSLLIYSLLDSAWFYFLLSLPTQSTLDDLRVFSLAMQNKLELSTVICT